MKHRISRVSVASSMIAVLAVVGSGPASAAGIAPRQYWGIYGSIVHECAYEVSLPSAEVETVNVVLSATATTMPYYSTNPPLATGVNCWLTPGSGGTGLTMPGTTVAAAGPASFRVSGALPDVCFSATAIYVGGVSDQTPVTCYPIDESVISIK